MCAMKEMCISRKGLGNKLFELEEKLSFMEKTVKQEQIKLVDELIEQEEEELE